MAAFLGTAAYTTNIGLIGVEIGLVAAAIVFVVVGIWGSKMVRKVL